MKLKTYLMMLFAMLFAFAVTMGPALVASTGSLAAAADEAVAEDEDATADAEEDDWDDWDDWDEDEEEEDAFGNIMQTTFATIDEVSYEAPAAGEVAAVTAKITFVDEDEEAEVTSVKLIYYLNGDLAAGNEVEMAAGDDGYTAEIPCQDAGTKVDFIIRIEDSNGNISTQAVASAKNLQAAVPDMDNSADIVGDDADIMNLSVGYDAEKLYVSFDVQGKIDGGTIDPPYIQLYGIKITNPDTEQGEGLMVGKLWIYLPLAKDPAVQEKFMPMLLEQGAEYIEKIGKEKIDKVMETGMMVLDIQKLMGGNFMEGMLFDAEPAGTIDGGTFIGEIKRVPLGENPSGYLRVIVLTAANASIDSFMPIPLNCSNFISVYTSAEGYTVK